MFKKSLAAVAVLGAFAANSMAADVTLYGKVDMGLQYENDSVEDFLGHENTTEGLTLDSGVGLASRIGLKATEDLGNGDKVAFKLEGDFKTDDGELNKGKLWQREASLSYIANWGTLYAGRYGSFSGAAGATDIVMDRMDVFDGGHKNVGLVGLGRMDNSITYFTPKIAGFQAAAMYSFKNDNAQKAAEGMNHEGHADADRYAGLALTYDIGALETAFSYEQLMRKSGADSIDDGKVITFGGNYNFDMFQLFIGGQYFEGLDSVTSSAKAMKSFNANVTEVLEDAGFNVPAGTTFVELGQDGVEGYGLHAGVEFQALNTNWEIGTYYIDSKADVAGLGGLLEGDVDGEYFGMNARAIYKLSKRTELRSSIAYDKVEWDEDWEKDRYLACVSLTHNF